MRWDNAHLSDDWSCSTPRGPLAPQQLLQGPGAQRPRQEGAQQCKQITEGFCKHQYDDHQSLRAKEIHCTQTFLNARRYTPASNRILKPASPYRVCFIAHSVKTQVDQKSLVYSIHEIIKWRWKLRTNYFFLIICYWCLKLQSTTFQLLFVLL